MSSTPCVKHVDCLIRELRPLAASLIVDQMQRDRHHPRFGALQPGCSQEILQYLSARLRSPAVHPSRIRCGGAGCTLEWGVVSSGPAATQQTCSRMSMAHNPGSLLMKQQMQRGRSALGWGGCHHSRTPCRTWCSADKYPAATAHWTSNHEANYSRWAHID